MIFKVQKSKKTTYVSLCIQLKSLYKYNEKKLLTEFNNRIDEEYHLQDINSPQLDRFNIIYFTGVSVKNEIVNCTELVSEKRKLEIEQDKKRMEQESRKFSSYYSELENYDTMGISSPPSYSNYSISTVYPAISVRTNNASTIRYGGISDYNSRIRMSYVTPLSTTTEIIPGSNTTANDRQGRENVVYSHDATTGITREEHLLDQQDLTDDVYFGVDGSIRLRQ